MEKIKKWRRFALALLSLLFVAIMSFALVQILPARAAETVDLTKSTADYTLLNEDSKYSWENSNKKIRLSTSSNKTETTYKSVLFQATKPGDIVLGWAISRYNENPDTTLNMESAPVSGLHFQFLVYKWSGEKGGNKGEPLFSNRYGSPKAIASPSLKDATELTIPNVQVGDYIEFRLESYSSAYGTDCYLFMNPPANTVDMTAKVAAGDEAYGDVSVDIKGQETSDEIQFQPRWFSDAVIEAHPVEGYSFTYWERDGKTVSYNAQYTVTDITESKSNNACYIAHFVKEGGSSTTSSQKEGTDQWNSAQDGRWNLDLENYAGGDTATLTYGFFAEVDQYVGFDYFESCNCFATASLYTLPLKAYLNGTEVKTFAPYNATHEDTNAIGKFAIPITKDGYNEIKIEFTISQSTWHYEEGDKIFFENFKVYNAEEVPTTEFIFTFESEWIKVEYADAAGKKTAAISGQPVSLTNGQMWTISASRAGSSIYKPSSIDPTVQVQYNTNGWRAEFGSVSQYIVPQGNSLSTSSSSTTFNNGSSVKIYRLNGAAEIEEVYQEYAPTPSVSVIKTVDGVAEEEQQISSKNNKIEFLFAHENSLTVRIKAFEALTQENYSVKVDGQPYDNLRVFEGYYMFVLDDVRQKSVAVSYVSDKYYCSLANISFTVYETVEGGINDTIHVGQESLSIEDLSDTAQKWKFDPSRSEVGDYTFLAGSSVIIPAGASSTSSGGGCSRLKLIFSGEQAGVLTFEFQMDGTFFTLKPQIQIEDTGAQLFSKFGADFTVRNSEDYNISGGNYNWGDDNATRLAWSTSATGGMESINIDETYITNLGNGWFRAKFSISADQKELYLLFVAGSGTMGDATHDQYMALRNVNFLAGSAQATVSLTEGSIGTFSASSGGTEYQEQKEQAIFSTLAIGDKIHLTANVNTDQTFYGWFVNDEFYSLEKELDYEVMGKSTNIAACIQAKNYYQARIGTHFYRALLGEGGALKAAESGEDKSVILVEEMTISQSFEIPAGVSLVLPYAPNGSYFASGTIASVKAQPRISWATAELEEEYKYLTLTIGQNVTITVNGTFIVGGVLYYPDQSAQGHTSGAYSELILGKGSKINVQKGGVFDVYGRVWGGEGKTGSDMGTIDVAEGGKLYEPFLILDFAGGSNTLDIFLEGITPFRRYAMINIEVPMTIHYGGKLIGHAGLYALSMLATLDQPFISDESGDGLGSDTMIMLKKDSSVTITYEANKVVGNASASNNTELIGKTTLEFTGGATFSYMQFTAMGITIPTTSVHFSIPYNFHLKLNGKDAQYETRTDFMIMPGAVVEVGEGATLTLNANAYVYDGLVQGDLSGKSYPTADELSSVGYSKSGNLIVNGTLVIAKKWALVEAKPSQNDLEPMTFLGIVQTSGNTGKIIIDPTAILSGTIKDGLEKNPAYYFEYKTTAQVWDAAHGNFGNLERGKTYTATGGVSFELKELNYTTTPGGEENQTLELSSDMVGSWMVVHGQHVYNWSQLSAEEKELKGAKYKELTRQCTELGCTGKEHHLLLKSGEGLSATYKGADFEADDLVELFKEHFGLTKGYEYFKVGAQITNGSLYNAGTYSNNVKFTLTNGVFLNGENGTASETLAFTITKFNVEKLDQAAIKNDLSGLVYDGTAKTPSLTLQADGLTGGVDREAFEWSNNTNAGENTASVTIKGSGQNFEGTLTVNFSIAKATLTVTLEETTQTYGTEPVTPKMKVEGAQNNEGSQIETAIERTAKAEQWSDVGEYGVKWTYNASEGVLKNYEIDFTNKDAELYKVTAKEIAGAATATAAGVTYNGNVQEAALSFTFAGYEGRFKTKDTDYTVSYAKDGETSPENAGTYTVTVKGNKNFTGSITCEYVISPKAVTVTVNAQTFTYDRTAHSYNDQQAETWTVADLAEGDDKSLLNVTITGSATDAGKHAVTCGYENGNYTVSFSGEETALVIEAAEITEVTVTGSYTYNGAVQEPKITVKAGNLTLNAGEYTVSYDKPEVKDADGYTVTVSAKSGNFKDKDPKVTGTFTIEKAKVTVTADDQSTPEGENILSGDALTWKVTDGTFFNNDQTEEGSHFKVTTTAVSTKADEEFPITIGWQEGYTCKNYEVTFKEGTYHIVAAIFKGVTVTGQTVNYNGEKQNIIVTIPNEEIKKVATVSITKDGQKFEGETDAGTYQLQVDITAEGYTTKYQLAVTFTINKIAVTVTFDAKSSTYGDAVKTEAELTYTMPEGVLQKDQDTFKAAIHPTTDAESKSAAGGNYKITATKPELTNYDVTIVDGKYTITARAVDVTVNKQTVTYNQKPQSASSDTANWSVTNLAGGDEATVLNVNLEANGTNAGSYDITATWSNNNYAVTFTGADGLTVEEGNKVKNAFVIEAAQLTDATVTGSYTYNGQAQTPTFNVKAGELVVEEGGFELEFAADADRVSAGTVNVTVKAKGSNYKGSLEKSFTIAAKKIKVTLNAQTADYSGKTPTPDNHAYTVEQGGLCSRDGKEDDLGVTITLVNGNKNVGSYGLDATASNENYEVEFDKTAQFTVTKKQITVKADDLKSFYGDDLKELTYTAKGLVEGEDAKTVLKITLEPERTIKEVGAYTIRGTGSAENYAFDKVEEGTYTVEKREVTVTIKDQSSLYDGTEPTLLQGQGDGWTVPDGSIIAGDNLFIVLTKAEGADAAEYAISGAFKNDNYNVTFKGTMGEAGKFTIRARELTVEIHDQSETYDHEKAQKQYGKEYKFDGGAWSIVLSSGDGLADGETREMLEISLQVVGTLSNAGKYAIAGECGNTNYAVTFTGNYGEDGEYKGTAGLYTIEKLDVSEEAAFMLSVKDGSDIKTEEGGAVVRVKFAGKAIELVCETTLLMGEDSVELATKLSRESIGAEEGIGSYEITVTIDDVNYCGQAVITVIVTDANGYTQRLKDVLAQLGELTAELDKEHLKAEDYTVLLEVVKALGSLDEEERKVGAEELAKYEEYVTAWEELADIGEVIETAKTVANAPIAALFEAAATLTALAGLAYIAFKGGML